MMKALEEAAQNNGFYDMEELVYLTSAFDMKDDAEVRAFTEWKCEDGTQEGLLKLFRSSAVTGYWQRTRPKFPAQYYVASRDGLLAGTRTVYRRDEGKLVEVGSEEWQGWWWSLPLVSPDPPKPVADEDW